MGISTSQRRLSRGLASDWNGSGRQARPPWRIGQRPTVRLIPHSDPAAQTLDLWAIPGRKSLSHDGGCLWLHGESGKELVTLTLSAEVQDGAPFAYAVPAGSIHGAIASHSRRR